MDDKRKLLIKQIKDLKEFVQKTLQNDFKYFHEELNQLRVEKNDENSTSYNFQGIKDAVTGDKNTYSFSIGEILYWIDELGYFEEYQRWADNQFYVISQYLKDQETRSKFNDLVVAVQKQRIVPFVGAGLSLPNNYPLWGTAIKEILEKIENDIDQKYKDSGLEKEDENTLHKRGTLQTCKALFQKKDYINLANELFILSDVNVNYYIREKFASKDDDCINGSILHLPELTNGCVITTNYDNLLERVFKDKGEPFEDWMHGIQIINQFTTKLAKGGACLLKLHGHYDSPQTYVFTKQQYDDAYGDEEGFDDSKPLTKVLTQIFISNSLLFLGCSLEEDRTLKLLIKLFEDKNFSLPEHFAFLPDPQDDKKKSSKEVDLARANIRVIWYDSSNNHEQLDDLIRYLIYKSKHVFIPPKVKVSE